MLKDLLGPAIYKQESCHLTLLQLKLDRDALAQTLNLKQLLSRTNEYIFAITFVNFKIFFYQLFDFY